MKRTKIILVVISILLMVTGFGLIHAGTPLIEYTGSALIGIPAIYLLYLLFLAYKNAPER